MELLQRSLTRLCEAGAVQADVPTRVTPEGLPPLAVYRVGEELFVTSDTCTHGRASLSEGTQEGTTIECPFHGGQFDVRTGLATLFPCRVPLQTYEVVVSDGWVCIEIGPVSQASN
ncbi:MAG: non-heme iron oxygenase ferredoxin subunit [Panacagrimonas sp.]